MTVSSFAGLTITASAATDIVSLDGTVEAGQWTCSDTNNRGAVTSETDDDGAYIQAKNSDKVAVTDTYAVTGATTAALGSKYVIEFDALMHGSNGSGGQEAEGTQIAFYSNNRASDTRSVTVNNSARTFGGVGKGFVVKYDVRRSYLGSDKGIVINDPAVEVPQDATATDYYTAEAKQDTWLRTRAVVDTSAKTATITIINKSGQKLVNAEPYAFDGAGDITGISITTGRADDGNTAFVNLDNVHIYAGDPDGELGTEGLRGEAAIATPLPAPETVAGKAPKLKAPESVTGAVTEDFESAEVKIYDSVTGTGETKQPVNIGSGVVQGFAGDRGSSGADGNSKVEVVNVTGGGKAAKLSGDRFAGGGRSPRLVLADDLSIADDPTKTSILGFSVYLSKVKEENAARLWLLDSQHAQDKDVNDSTSSDTWYYKNILGLLTAENEEQNGFGSENSNRVLNLEPEQWHTVVVAVSNGRYRIFYDEKYKSEGNLSPAIVNETVNYGQDAAYSVTNLPALVVENMVNERVSRVLVDNVIAYQVDNFVDEKALPVLDEGGEGQPTTEAHSVTIESTDGKTATVKTTEETPFDAVLIHAKYNNGALTSVKSYPVTGINATGVQAIKEADNATIATGDKLMVWDSLSGMVPYGVLTVTEGATEYGITTTGITNGTVTADPAKATAGTKVTLTVKPNDGYKLTADSLKVKHGTETITPTAVAGAADKYEFDMPAADVTVEAAFEAIEYTIAVDSALEAGASITTTPASKATVGTEVTVNVTAPDGKVVDKVTYKEEGATDATPITADATGAYKFTMPAKNVTVSATFKAGSVTPTEQVTVTLSNAVGVQGGTIAATVGTGTDPLPGDGKVDKGSKVVITLTPDSGKEVKTFTVDDTDKMADLVAGTGDVKTYTIESIQANTTIAATFGDKETTPTKAAFKDSFTVKLDPASDVTVGTQITASLEKSASNTDKEAPAGVTWKWQKVDGGSTQDVPDEINATFTPQEPATYQAVATLTEDSDDFTAGSVTSATVTVTAAPAVKHAVKVTVVGRGYAAASVTEAAEGEPVTLTIDNDKYHTAAVTGVTGYNDGEKTFTMPDEDANVTVTFTESFPTTFSISKTEDFESGEQTLFTKTGGTGPMEVADDSANANAKTGKVLKARGDTDGNNGRCEITAANLGIENAAYVQLDARLDCAQSNKTSLLSLRDKDNKAIFTINVTATGNGNGGGANINGNITLDKAIVSNERDKVQQLADRQGSGWLTVSAAIDFDAKSSKVLITRVSDGSLVYFGDVPFADNTAAGLDKIYAEAGKLYGAAGIDDVTIKGAKATNVTVTPPTTGGSLSYKKDGSKIVIIPTPDSGKKVKTVTVTDGAEGEPKPVQANESGAYEYTPTTDTVTIAAEFVRDDIATVTVTGDDTVQKGAASTAPYAATFASAKGEAVTLEDGEQITWSVTGATNETDTKIENGTLTIAADEEAAKVTVIASVPKKNGEAEAVTGSMEVNVSSETLYNVTKADIAEGGDITIEPNRAAAGTKVYVTATPETGYEVDDIKIKGTVTEEKSIKDSFAESKYSFDMASEDITVTATFKKIKYGITNGSEEGDRTENGGYISKIEVSDADATEAVMGDTVKVTLTPEAKYESAGVEVTGAEDIEVTPGETNVYTFTMPAAAVTVTAKFQKEALADRKPTGFEYDNETLYELLVNAKQGKGGGGYDGAQTTRVGDRLVTPAKENRRFDVPGNLSINPGTVYFVCDFNVTAGETITFLGKKGNDYPGATLSFIADAQGAIKAQVGSNAAKETTLEAGKWYNMVLKGERDATGHANGTVAVYEIDDTNDTVKTDNNLLKDAGLETVSMSTANYPWSATHCGGTADGTSALDNAYYCTDPFYEAKITVTGTDNGEVAGDNNPTPVNDATVTVKKDGKEVAKQTSGAEGVYTFKLQAGTYSVEVAATEAYEAKTLASFEVTKEGANTATINPKKQDTKVASIDVTDKLGDAHKDSGSEFTVLSSEQQKTIQLTATAKNEGGAVVKDTEFTWDSDKKDNGVTVSEGLVTIAATTGASEDVTARLQQQPERA